MLAGPWSPVTCLSKLKTLSVCERQFGELEALRSLRGELVLERSPVPLGLLVGGISFIVVVRFYYNVFQTINIVELKGIISTIVIWKSNRLLKCKT